MCGKKGGASSNFFFKAMTVNDMVRRFHASPPLASFGQT